MKEISQRIFGTTDYESMLDILSPNDGMVKEFRREVETMTQTEGEL